ncbi:fimbrillin family protein [Elizabethkingia anophelis]|nr:fimbrillin family protein [Elizabethkingia anophelis]
MKTLHKKYQSIISSLILVITSIILILSFLSLSSCRSAEHDHIVTGGGIAAVKINLLGSDYASGKSSNQADLKETGLPVKDNVQRQSKMITPSLFFEAELAPSNNDANKSGRASTEPTALTAGDQIGAGMKFRIIAYRQDDNSYQAYQDYTVGEQAQPLMLDSGKAYTIIAYSYGSTSALPGISTGEMTNLSQAKINYDDNNKDLMYQKIEGFIPDGNNPNNKVDIKLRHKLSQITTVINSYIGDISEISWAYLRPHHPEGVLLLSNGVVSRTYEGDERLTFSGTFPTTTATADPVLINADTGGGLTGLLSASLTVNNVGRTISFPNSFKITPEYKSTLTINFKKCGAYLGPNNTQWKEFMCHNLGADMNADPFTPSPAIHGAKYQWGYKPINENTSDDRYYTQTEDQANNGVIVGWNQTGMSDDSWSDISKTVNDPCPDGFRVPTSVQWEAIVANNMTSQIGSWSPSDSNFGGMAKLGDHLYLHTAGYRRANNDGEIDTRGGLISYWSSTISSLSNYAYELSWYYSGGIQGRSNSSKINGLSIRCISK